MSWAERESAEALFKACGDVLVRGHFIGASGLHLDAYFSKTAIFSHPEILKRLCRNMWFPYGDAKAWPHPPQRGNARRCVVGPESGGAIIARACVEDMRERYERMAAVLGAAMNVLDAHAVGVAKTSEGGYALTEEQSALVYGADCLVVEDVLTTGTAARLTAEAVTRAGGNVLRIAALVNRGNVTAKDLGVRELRALMALSLPSWTDEQCLVDGPCSRGEAIRTDLGKGREYLQKRAALAAAAAATAAPPEGSSPEGRG